MKSLEKNTETSHAYRYLDWKALRELASAWGTDRKTHYTANLEQIRRGENMLKNIQYVKQIWQKKCWKIRFETDSIFQYHKYFGIWINYRSPNLDNHSIVLFTCRCFWVYIKDYFKGHSVIRMIKMRKFFQEFSCDV